MCDCIKSRELLLYIANWLSARVMLVKCRSVKLAQEIARALPSPRNSQSEMKHPPLYVNINTHKFNFKVGIYIYLLSISTAISVSYTVGIFSFLLHSTFLLFNALFIFCLTFRFIVADIKYNTRIVCLLLG